MRGNNNSRKLAKPDIVKGEVRHTESGGDASLDPLLEEIRQKHGEALLAILVYGSWLRG